MSAKVKVPESITLPEDAELEMELVKTEDSSYEKDIALIEKGGKGYFLRRIPDL